MKIATSFPAALLLVGGIGAGSSFAAAEGGDPATERAADYFELYDNSGRNILAVSWFDRFGIERMAVDRGVLERADKPEGILIVIVDGDEV